MRITADSVNMPGGPPEDNDAPLSTALARARPALEPGVARELRVARVLGALFGEAEVVRVGDYEIVDRLGAGGMGVVYRARHADGRLVAVKVLERGQERDRERFARETVALASVRHPHVVRYLDHGETSEGMPFLVMELLEGVDLATRLGLGRLETPDALELAAQLAQGLAAAHAVGVVHRDVKPGNVFLVGGRLDDVRLVDLGLARSVEGSQRLTSTGGAVGTPAYMAPEQLRGEDDFRADVYGLGATLFEALAGVPPFRGAHPAAVLLAIVSEPAPELRSLRADIPADVSDFVARLLAKDPDDRPRTMEAVLADLALVRAGFQRGRGLSRAERRPASRPTRVDGDSGGAIIGRGAERHRALSEIARSVEDHVSTRVVLHGERGSGRTALLATILDTVERELPEAQRIVGVAGAGNAGAPFSTWRALFPADGVWAPVEALIQQATADHPDPIALADRIHVEWLDAMEAATDDRPLLIAVDDADRADLATLRLLVRAHDAFRDRPLAIVLVTSGAQRGAALEGHLIEVGPLGLRTLDRLAARWAPSSSGPARAARVARSAGNPGLLRDLCRSADDDGGAPSRSVADLIWRAFEALDPEHRRVLRAASIAGDGPAELVRAILGDDVGPFARKVERLVADGFLVADRDRLGIASERVRVAAEASCTEEDARDGNRRAAEWHLTRAPHDPQAVGRHWLLAGENARAVPHLLAAARAALAGQDVDAFEERCREVRAATPDCVELDALVALSLFWRGRIGEARIAAEGAATRLPYATAAWHRAVALAITAAGQAGDQDGVIRLATMVAAAPGGDERLVALGRAVSQLAVADALPAALRTSFEADADRAAGPDARAWVARARAAAAQFGFDTLLGAYAVAHRAHREAGDERAAAQIAIYLASVAVWSGAFDRAREAADDAARVARRLDADYLVVWARYAEAKLLVETAPWPDAREALEEVVARTQASPRMRAGAWVWRAIGELKADDPEAAMHAAEAALAAHSAAAVGVPAIAAMMLAQLRLGRAEDARATYARLMAHAGPLVEFAELAALARVEGARRSDDPAAAVAAAQAGRALIEARAATLDDPLRRNDYRLRPWAAARLAEITTLP